MASVVPYFSGHPGIPGWRHRIPGLRMRQQRSYGTKEQKPPRIRGQRTLCRCARRGRQRETTVDSAGTYKRTNGQTGAGRSDRVHNLFGDPPPETALQTQSCAGRSQRATSELPARPVRIGHRRQRESHPQCSCSRWRWRDADNSGQRPPRLTHGDCGAYRSCHNYLNKPFQEGLTRRACARLHRGDSVREVSLLGLLRNPDPDRSNQS